MKKIISLTLSILFLATLASNLLAQENANEKADGNVNYGEIMEDISVMARIIDKTLAGKFPGDYGSEKIGFFGGSSGCEGIYLKGYGVVFITSINFPLSAQKVEEKREVKPYDLWQQTKEEIEQGVSALPVPGPKVETWIRYGEGFIAYDSGRVETLKQELISLILTYGQNIRNLKPQDNIVIVVKGGSQTKAFTYEISVPPPMTFWDPSKSGWLVVAPNDPNGTSFDVEAVPAQNMPIGTDVAIAEVHKSGDGKVPESIQSDDAKKQMEKAQMEAARVGSEIAKQLATQEKRSAVTSLKRNVRSSILTIKVSKEDITAQKNGSISTDEFMKRAEITQY